MNKIHRIHVLFMGFLFSLPLGVLAQGGVSNGIVQCGRDGGVCGWQDLLITIQRLLDFVLLYVAIPIATIVIIVGGFTMIFSFGNEAKFKKGRQMITGVAVGFVITFCAWILVKTLIAIFF